MKSNLAEISENHFCIVYMGHRSPQTVMLIKVAAVFYHNTYSNPYYLVGNQYLCPSFSKTLL